MQRNCPSQRAYVATEDGGYISTSDVEEDIDDGAADNHDDDNEGLVFGCDDTVDYRSIIVQQVLSTQLAQAEKQHRHNLF